MRRSYDPSQSRSASRTLSTVLAGVALSLLTGCDNSQPVVTELPPAEQNLRYIVMAYTQAAAELGRGPADENELMPYLKEYGDVEANLTSPVDTRPYLIVWGVDVNNIRGGSFPILACERTVQEGTHRAIDVRLRIRELTPPQFFVLSSGAD